MASDIAIGYNIKQAKELMDTVKEKYDSLKSTIVDNWGNVQSTMQSEWIGEDEISFEASFVDRVNTLYANAATLATNCCGVVAGLCNQWSNFQANNILSNGTAGTATTIEALTFSGEDVISAKAEQLDESTDRGLKSETSATTIQSSVSEYVTAIKGKAQSLFEEISSNNAFFGDQVTKIDSYVHTCGYSIGQVVTAVKDLHDNLAELAGTQYKTTVSNFEEALGTEETNMRNADESLGDSRWSTN